MKKLLMLVALWGWALGAHAQVAINALPANAAPSNADVLATQQLPSARNGDGTVQTTIAQIDATADTLSNKVYSSPVITGQSSSTNTVPGSVVGGYVGTLINQTDNGSVSLNTYGLSVNDTVGAGANGQKIGIGGAVFSTGGTANESFVGMYGLAQAGAGSPTGSLLFGINGECFVAASVAVGTCISYESDTQTGTGSTVTNRIGVGSADHNSVVQGSSYDAAFAVYAGTTAVGWKNGYLISNFGGAGSAPISSAGNAFYIDTAMSMANGINLINGTFSGKAFESTGFSVDGSGNTSEGTDTATVAFVAPVSSGSTMSYQVAGGSGTGIYFPSTTTADLCGNTNCEISVIGATGSTVIGNATGGGKGANTLNVGGIFYENNVEVITAAGLLFQPSLSGVSTGANADFLCLSSAGLVLLQSSSCTISSLRFKENVNPFTGDALSELDKLQVKSYQMKDTHNRDPNASREQIGLIAENIAEVEPKCAIYEDDLKTPKSYRPECITALLVKAAQENRAVVSRQIEFIYLLLALVGLLTLHGGHLHFKMRRLQAS